MPWHRGTLVKCLLGSIVAGIVLIGLLFALFGFVVGRVPAYRVQLQDWIGERTGMIVEFQTLGARLRLYGPELVFDEAVVLTPDRSYVLAAARRGSIAFDLWNSLRTGRLTAGRFSLEAPQIGLVRTREGRIELIGQSALPERATSFSLEQLPTGRFHVEHAAVSFRDAITGRGPWSLSGVNFELLRDPESLRLHGDASLPQALGGALRFNATIEGALEDSAALVSTFAISGDAVDLAGWADVLPDEWLAPEMGRGSLRVNGRLQGAKLMQLSAKVDFAQVAAAAPEWTIPLPVAAPMQRPEPGGAEASVGVEAAPAQGGAATAQGGAATAQGDAATAQDEAPRADAAAPAQPSAAPAPAPAPQPSAPAHAPPSVVSYERVAFELQARRVEDAWKVSLDNLDLSTAQSPWRSGRIEAQWQRGPDGMIVADGHADRLVLGNFWPLLAYLPESDALARLRALDARGAIDDFQMHYRRGPSGEPQYQVTAKLEALSFEPTLRAPGLSGVSGELRASERDGELRLDARDFRFELPWLFREPLSAQVLQAPVTWQRLADGWVIRGAQFQVRSEDGSAAGRFTAKVPADGSSPLLDLTAQGRDLQVSATRKYIPAGRLGEKTAEWFDRAFLDGRIPEAQLVYRGPTRKFPFRQDEGEFLARAEVEGAVFDYQPGWTPARNVRAQVEFHNKGMQVRASAGQIGELRVSGATARIADLKETRLVIDAAATGRLGNGLRFLQDGPLGPTLGERFARLEGSGPLDAHVHLDLPIRHLEDRNIEVTARVDGATLSMQGIDAPVHALSGSLTVRNTLLAQAGLRGDWLGGPVELEIRPLDDSQQLSSLLTARGHAAAVPLRELLHLPASIELAGATDWGVTMALEPADAHRAAERTVRIESDLRGLAIGLPQPLGKSADDTAALQVTLHFEDDATVLARSSLGEVRSLIRARRDQQGWTLDRGGVRADGIAPALPDHRGLRIEGAIERFVLDDWLALRDSSDAGDGNGNGKPLSEYLQAANVRIAQLEVGGYRFADVRGVLQAMSAGWRVDVSGAQAAGQIVIPEDFAGEQPLRATLEHLVLEKSGESSEGADTQRDPRTLPNLQVHVGDLRLGSRNVGEVELRATRVAQGIRFDGVTITGASARGEGRGEWLVTSEGQRASLNATVESSDVAATLSALGYGEFIQAEHGRVHADLSWPGGYTGNILEHASGAITVDADNGQLVNVQPGAGRVLGLFSIAALPRRLALDFSDLTEKGLAFDSVHGDFELRDGNAYTSNLLLRGPAAEIGIAGRTGLAARDYDQTAVVTGNLGASLPVAGALAGGPAVGAALLLFSQVFKEPLKGITRGYYRITGPWDDPVVQRIDAAEAKAEASGVAATGTRATGAPASRPREAGGASESPASEPATVEPPANVRPADEGATRGPAADGSAIERREAPAAGTSANGAPRSDAPANEAPANEAPANEAPANESRAVESGARPGPETEPRVATGR